MARVRQARRCRAHRTNGEPCKAWAINGGYVCRMHGGATPSALRAAEWRLDRAAIHREFRAAERRYAADMLRWRGDRILTAAAWLAIPVEEVTERDIIMAAIMRGSPGKPKPGMRRDRRYGRRVRRFG